MNFDQNAHPEIIDLVRGFSDTEGKFLVTIQGRFDASHFLYKYFPDGSDEPLHGHSWLVEVELSSSGGTVGSDGMVFDYLAARNRLDQLLERLEHVVINNLQEFSGINPTSENIARWFYAGLRNDVQRSGGKVVSVRVHEGPFNSATFYPDDASEFKR